MDCIKQKEGVSLKRIVLTGGGTAGHVTPNIALLPSLRAAGYEIFYIGSYDGIEKRLMADFGVEYHGIATGKFRRYFDLKNFSDPFRVLKGYREAKKILKEIDPDIIFSKGGFVSVPVVRAAADLKIPCIIHESDMSPGLANKLCIPVADKVCCNFPETGAQSINEVVRESLDNLLKDFQVVHICGKEKMDNLMLSVPGYKQFEYLKTELKDVFAMSDVVISRAGANAICEIAALQKPNILIPLSRKASRGDQILNANSFKKQGFSEVIEEEDVTKESLVNMINQVYDNREKYIDAMAKSNNNDAITTILDLIEKNAK